MEKQERLGRLIFDGSCPLCSYLATKAAELDSGRGFAIVPFQDIPEEELERFGLNYRKCAKELQLVLSNGEVHSGAFAVNLFLYHLQRPWNLISLIPYAVPPILLLEVFGYKIVTKNRHRISRWLPL